MKVFKKLLSLGLVLGLTLSLVGCSGGGEKTKLEQIKDNGKLVVGTSAEFPPFEFHKVVDGKDSIKGFDIMLAEEFAKELGVKVEIKDMSFDGLIGALNADQVDIVLAGMSPTPEREKSVDFSELYYLSRNAVIVKDADIDKVKTEDDLKKLRVGVQAGSIQEEYVVNTLKMTTTKSLKAIPDLITELKNGNIDAVVTNEAVSLINVKKYDGIKMANTEVGKDVTEGMAAAIKKSDNNKDFIELLNKKIKELQDGKKIEEFLNEASTEAAYKLVRKLCGR